jgi:DUF4097 and DUF4098 domain-containing protein YvlB
MGTRTPQKITMQFVRENIRYHRRTHSHRTRRAQKPPGRSRSRANSKRHSQLKPQRNRSSRSREAAEEAAAEAAEAAEEAIDKMFWDVVTKSDAEATEPELTRVAATRARALADRARIKTTTISSTVETVRNIPPIYSTKHNRHRPLNKNYRKIRRVRISCAEQPHDINLQKALLDHIEAVSAHVSLFIETNQTMADKLNDLISEDSTHDAVQAERDTALENAATVAEQVASDTKQIDTYGEIQRGRNTELVGVGVRARRRGQKTN